MKIWSKIKGTNVNYDPYQKFSNKIWLKLKKDIRKSLNNNVIKSNYLF